jgi:hypothetical protein
MEYYNAYFLIKFYPDLLIGKASDYGKKDQFSISIFGRGRLFQCFFM